MIQYLKNIADTLSMRPRSRQNRRWKAEKVNCEAREATLVCENFDSGIVKIIEWYLNKYEVNK